MKRLLLLLLLTVSAIGQHTYYISTAGSDSNTPNQAQSRVTPWQHSPGMQNCTALCASYVPVAGDQFIFRGGDVWTDVIAGVNFINFNWGGNANVGGGPIYLGAGDGSWWAAKVVSVTDGAILNNTLTITASNTYQSGTQVTLSGFGGSGAFLNGQTVQVLPANLTSSQFTASLIHGNVGSIGAGTGTQAAWTRPVFDCQLNPLCADGNGRGTMLIWNKAYGIVDNIEWKGLYIAYTTKPSASKMEFTYASAGHIEEKFNYAHGVGHDPTIKYNVSAVQVTNNVNSQPIVTLTLNGRVLGSDIFHVGWWVNMGNFPSAFNNFLNNANLIVCDAGTPGCVNPSGSTVTAIYASAHANVALTAVAGYVESPGITNLWFYDGYIGGGGIALAGNHIHHNLIDYGDEIGSSNGPGTSDIGQGIGNADEVDHNVIRNNTNGINGTVNSVHDNLIEYIYDYFGTNPPHCDGYYDKGALYLNNGTRSIKTIYNNVNRHYRCSGGLVFYINGLGEDGPTNTTYFFNNIGYDNDVASTAFMNNGFHVNDTNACLNGAWTKGGPIWGTTYVYGNIFVSRTSKAPVTPTGDALMADRVTYYCTRTTTPYSGVAPTYYDNNYFITTASPCVVSGVEGPGTQNCNNLGHNRVRTTLDAGYCASDWDASCSSTFPYYPPNGSSPTVAAGTNASSLIPTFGSAFGNATTTVTFNDVTKTVIDPYVTSIARPNSPTAWDAGPYQFATPTSPFQLILRCNSGDTGAGTIAASDNSVANTCAAGASTGCPFGSPVGDGIGCTSGSNYSAGNTVSVTESPIAGVFNGFSGDCTTPICNLTYTINDFAVTASFELPPSISIVSVAPSACNIINGCDLAITVATGGLNLTGGQWSLTGITGDTVTDTSTGKLASCIFGANTDFCSGTPSGTFVAHLHISPSFAFTYDLFTATAQVPGQTISDTQTVPIVGRFGGRHRGPVRR